jgi:hypothetical protein
MSLERYAELTVALFGKEGPARAEVAARFGLSDDRIDPLIEEWTAKLQSDHDTLTRYNDLYQQELVKAGVQRPDVPMETYAKILGQASGGKQVQAVAAEHGMDMQQFAMVAQYWGQKMQADTGLAIRFAELMMEARGGGS